MNGGDILDTSDENYVYYLVGQNLKRIRKEKNIPAKEVAKKSRYSVGFIMNMESPKYHQTFALGTIWKLAQVLDVDIRELFRPLDQQ